MIMSTLKRKIIGSIVIITLLIISIWYFGSRATHRPNIEQSNLALINLSEKLLNEIKEARSTDSIVKALRGYSLEDLKQDLPNDDARKTFWINLYNSYYQLLANQKTSEIFTSKAIHFADIDLSLDDVEHGILRRYRWKYSFGYLPQFLPSPSVKSLAVNTIDYRIHFALNCGAVSCPPIANYNLDAIDRQLDFATKKFLSLETTIDKETKTIRTTRIMSWFQGDFGGKSGIQKILGDILSEDLSDYTIIFNEYDWTEKLMNFE